MNTPEQISDEEIEISEAIYNGLRENDDYEKHYLAGMNKKLIAHYNATRDVVSVLSKHENDLIKSILKSENISLAGLLRQALREWQIKYQGLDDNQISIKQKLITSLGECPKIKVTEKIMKDNPMLFGDVEKAKDRIKKLSTPEEIEKLKDFAIENGYLPPQPTGSDSESND
jgi:hypothetical protein